MIDRRFKASLVLSKALAIFTMITIHAGIVMSSVYKIPVVSVGHSLFSIIGFYTLSLPILAGISLRVDSDSEMFNGSLISLDWRQMGLMTCLLMLASGLRSFLFSFNISHIFIWDVLPTVALSFLLINVLVKRSITLLYICSIFILVITPFLHPYLSQIRINTNPDYRMPISLLFSGLLTFIIIYPLYSLQFIGRKIMLFLVPFLFSLFLWKIFHEVSHSETWFNMLLNFPFTLWSGDSPAPMYWPFLNWFPTIAFGFIFAHFLEQDRSLKSMRIIHVVSLIFFILLMVVGGDDFNSKINAITFQSFDLFEVSPVTVLTICAFFVCHFIAIWMITPYFKFSQDGAISNLSRAILPVYIFHSVFVYWVARLFYWWGINQLLGYIILIITTLYTSIKFAHYWVVSKHRLSNI